MEFLHAMEKLQAEEHRHETAVQNHKADEAEEQEKENTSVTLMKWWNNIKHLLLNWTIRKVIVRRMSAGS